MLLLNYQPSWLIYAKLLDLSDIRARVQPVVTETATKPWQAPGKRSTAPLAATTSFLTCGGAPATVGHTS